MTTAALVSALVVGITIGLVGGLITRWRGEAPVWLAVSIGVVAALAGTITAPLAGIDTSEVNPVALIVQVGSAVFCVGVVVLTARPHRSGQR